MKPEERLTQTEKLLETAARYIDRHSQRIEQNETEISQLRRSLTEVLTLFSELATYQRQSQAEIQLIIAHESQAPVLVQQLLQRAKTEIRDPWVTRDIIELLETVLVSKFAQLGRQEIQSMFLLSDIKQTRVYQEAREEGRQDEASSILQRQLSKRFGKIGDRNLEAINQLSLGQLEDLGEALLDFGDITDLDGWLESQIKL